MAMESMVRLDSYDPGIREYLLKHRYPVIMEVPKAANNLNRSVILVIGRAGASDRLECHDASRPVGICAGEASDAQGQRRLSCCSALVS